MRKIKIIEIELEDGEYFDIVRDLSPTEAHSTDVIKIVQTKIAKEISYAKHRYPTLDTPWYVR